MNPPPTLASLTARLACLRAEVDRLNALYDRCERALPLDPKDCRRPKQLPPVASCQTSPRDVSRQPQPL